MGDLAFLDIVFFALVAGFLILRLRSVLGRRTGNENSERWTPKLPTRGPLSGPRPVDASDRPAPIDVAIPRELNVEPGSPLEQTLNRIKQSDPSFDPAGFVGGARQAFEMIVTAFAQGDTASLRPLLADDVYENFAAAIKGRQDAKQTLETTIIGIKSADIIEARIDGKSVFVTVKFVTEQVNVTRNAAGEVVDGDSNHVAKITDVWTFARALRSSDPNWALVQTSESH